MSDIVAIINTPSQLGRHSLSCQVSHECILNFVLAGVIDTPSQLGSHTSWSYFGEDICNLLKCRKVLHVYNFPLHHISEIRIFHLIVFRSIRKHWVFKELYSRLLVIIIGSISWSSKSIKIFLKPHCFAHSMLIYYAFVVLKDTEFCFLLHQETMTNFTVEHQLDVFFRSTVLSARSESAYPANSISH